MTRQQSKDESQLTSLRCFATKCKKPHHTRDIAVSFTAVYLFLGTLSMTFLKSISNLRHEVACFSFLFCFVFCLLFCLLFFFILCFVVVVVVLFCFCFCVLFYVVFCCFCFCLRQKSWSPSSDSCVAAREIVRRSFLGPIRDIA